MRRFRRAILAGAATFCVGGAAAQIVPQEPVPPVPAQPAVEPTVEPSSPRMSVSMSDLKAAFASVGLAVEAKTAPNGLQYFEARNNGDLIFGATVLCAGENQTQCKKVVLESGQMNRAVTYEEVTRFNTSGFASRVVTYDLKKKEPSLTLVVELHGSFSGDMLPGTIKGLMSDMQNFAGQIQGRQTTGFAADATPEGAISGGFNLAPERGPGATTGFSGAQ